MECNQIGFIGLGLIGGSLAKAIKRVYPQADIIATSGHQETVDDAAKEGVISNHRLLEMKDFSDCDLIVLCCPVQKNIEYLKMLKPFVKPGCLITDVGSVKGDIHRSVRSLGLEHCFIGGHPMAGSERTGFAASTSYLLENAYYILTPTEQTTVHDLEDFRLFIASLGAIPLVMDCGKHDHATASISHLPHIIAASLVNLIAETDDSQETMKTIAAGGFKDITRIASSSPEMWQHICASNREHILHLMDDFAAELSRMRGFIASESSDEIRNFFLSAKNYRDSINISTAGPIRQVYECFCDLIDEAGGIATIATILASNNLSIKNIGILHNREFENGVLHIEMYDAPSLEQAVALLRKYHYTVYER